MSRTRTSGTEASSPGKKSFHRHVDRAMAGGHALLIHYKKLNGRTVKRKIEPRSWRGNTLVAYDHKRKAVRSFRMERVQHMEKAAFWRGFEKQAFVHSSAFGHIKNVAELGGLGYLARDVPKHWNDADAEKRRTARTEGVGLGVLAAPAAAELGHAAWTGGKKLFRKAAEDDKAKRRLKAGLGMLGGGTLLGLGVLAATRHDKKRGAALYGDLTKKIHAGTATQAERAAHAQMTFNGYIPH